MSDPRHASIYQLLRHSPLCHGLVADELHRIADALRGVPYAAGAVVARQGEPGRSMFLVSRGRVRVTLARDHEPPRLLAYLGRGDHFGDMALLGDHVRPATITAVVDSELLELDQERFDQLLVSVPGFAANLSRALVLRLRQEMTRRRRRERPTIVGLVNTTARTQGLIRHLTKALVSRGESIEVLTDRPEKWPSEGGYLIERIPAAPTAAERAARVRARIEQVIGHQVRILLDLTQQSSPSELALLLSPCEEVWWLVDSRFSEGAVERLQGVIDTAPHLAPRIHWVWILHRDERFAPRLSAPLAIGSIDFKITLEDEAERASWRQRQGVERLVRHLRGTRLGIALGGGGARGLAHLGVLRALDHEGIHFDLVAGTSSGALMGLAYCGGWRPDTALESLRTALTPARLFRLLPGGMRWYLWSKYRRLAWDIMLRPYLGDTCLEQLPVPLFVMAVDLIGGAQVVRERGDAVHAVMESINLPYFARPILRDGMALVDGGVLNNLPVDVLPEKGADFVVGVDVVSKLPPDFAGTADKPRRPGVLETLLRVTEVQALGVTSLRAHALDLLIAPDTSAFEFADFTQARALAEVGERAAHDILPKLKELIGELEADATRALTK
ncbi:MAG TPA: cyclic nucleotide-binding and patatin-like phospholipase domain-containing protein [Pirellulales bacterium]|nr:cyclic nucleotide-binding and patatin-like phospholipase domain-containing protein [Pirellulales bacterium]